MNIIAYVKKTDNPKMGRPAPNPRSIGLNLRITQDERDLLDKCCALTGKKKTEVVIEGIEMFYKAQQKK